jgi:hypothetical protein
LNSARHAFASPVKTDRFVCLLAGARGLADVVAAVRDYLAAWPAELIAHVQKVDAGWAPFDEDQQPIPLHRPADLREIYEAVHGQCTALRGAGVTVAPELLELDLFLYFAYARLTELEPRTPAATGTAVHCSFGTSGVA